MGRLVLRLVDQGAGLDPGHHVTQACTDFCKPLTPNGCDCFGCCENPLSPGNYVWAGSVDSAGVPTCDSTAAALGDPAKCKACTPVPGCNNPCGHCELCFGKTTLPADCTAPTSDLSMAERCAAGVQPCGLPADPACPMGTFCITGCCVSILF